MTISPSRSEDHTPVADPQAMVGVGASQPDDGDGIPRGKARDGGDETPTDWRVQTAKVLLGLAGVPDLPEAAAHSMPSDCFSASAEIVDERRMLCVEPSKRLHLIVQRSFGWHMIEHPRNQINGCIG